MGKGLEASPTLRRQYNLSRHYYPRGSPAPFRKFARSKSLVELPTFTENPEKGAAEQLSRTPSRASLNPIAEDLAEERWTDSNNTRQARNEVCE